MNTLRKGHYKSLRNYASSLRSSSWFPSLINPLPFLSPLLIFSVTHRLITPSSSNNLQTLVPSFPGCGNGVILPTSTKLNPVFNKLTGQSQCLSKPAASPIGPGKVMFLTGRRPGMEGEEENGVRGGSALAPRSDFLELWSGRCC